MMKDSELERLLSTATATGALALVIGVFRGVIQEKHGDLLSFTRGVLASITVAVLVGWGLSETSLGLAGQMSIVGVCSYLADDLLVGLLVLGKLFREDPSSFLGRVYDVIRGKSSKRHKDDDVDTHSHPGGYDKYPPEAYSPTLPHKVDTTDYADDLPNPPKKNPLHDRNPK